MPGLLLLVLLCCAGCHGQLVHALEERHIASCIWWHGPLGSSRGVTATGGMDVRACLAQCHTWP